MRKHSTHYARMLESTYQALRACVGWFCINEECRGILESVEKFGKHIRIIIQSTVKGMELRQRFTIKFHGRSLFKEKMKTGIFGDFLEKIAVVGDLLFAPVFHCLLSLPSTD